MNNQIYNNDLDWFTEIVEGHRQFSEALEAYHSPNTIKSVSDPVELAPTAEITKGRVISDAERSLIETRIATRKALRGE